MLFFGASRNTCAIYLVAEASVLGNVSDISANVWLTFLALVANRLRCKLGGTIYGRDKPELRLIHL